MGDESEDVARRYVRLVQAGDVEGVVGLYAPDGVVAHANPDVEPALITGHDQLREFYGHITANQPQMTNIRIKPFDDGCVLQFTGVPSSGERQVEMVDVFMMDGHGRIARMDAYTRGRANVVGGTI